jgi:hypothetical protein
MSLSVCCPTGDPGPRVHALLEPLRAVADEIVVAADSRTSAEDLGWYAAVADRLTTFEYAGDVERMFGWLHAQCSSDWILLIAGDECASPGLIARLPELTAQRSFNQVFIPVRWLYPDPDHWLDEFPWCPDLHNRLVRNDGALSFRGVNHTDAIRVDPVGIVEEPIYHMATLAPVEARRAKVDRYRRSRTDLAVGGRPVNELYYLPEESSRRAPAPVPPEDRAAVAALIAGTPGPGPAPAPALGVPAASLAETDRFWSGRAFDAGGYRARLELAERDLAFAPGQERGVLVRVANDGTERWPWGLDRAPHVHIAYERWDAAARAWIDPGFVTPLPHTIEPGSRVPVAVTVIAPPEPGAHVLRVDLRHAGHRWFGAPLELRIRVG